MKRVTKNLPLVLTLAALILMVGCAAGPNTVVDTAASDGIVAGFWLGLWHGTIAPITFVISLFEHSVNIYEVHNNGAWYNLGFAMGAGLLLGGSGTAASRRRNRN